MADFLAAVCKADILGQGEGDNKVWYFHHKRFMLIAEKGLHIVFVADRKSTNATIWNATNVPITTITFTGSGGSVSWLATKDYEFSTDYKDDDKLFQYLLDCEKDRMSKVMDDYWTRLENDDGEEEMDRILEKARKDNREYTGTEI